MRSNGLRATLVSVTARRVDIAERLRDAIAVSGLTRLELAERLGVDESTISRYANGLTSPSPARWAQIENALGLKLTGPPPATAEDVEGLRQLIREQAGLLKDLSARVEDLDAELKQLKRAAGRGRRESL